MIGDYVYYKKGYKYQLAKDFCLFIDIFPLKYIETDYISLSTRGFLRIKKGYAWDGASGPTIDTKDSIRGSLVHDALYQLMRLGELSQRFRPDADQLLHDLCEMDGMNPIRADLWEKAVRCFAAKYAEVGSEPVVLMAP